MINKVLVIAGFISLVSAHGFVHQVKLNGETYDGPSPSYGEEWKSKGPIRQVENLDPITDIYSPNLACGRNSIPSEYEAEVPAGSDIEFVWSGGNEGYPWPHKRGPLTTYMANCGKDCNEVDPTTLDFFKISEHDKGDDGVWAQENLVSFDTAKSKIPWDIQEGHYIIRHEIIALHKANEYMGCEFYPSCTTVYVTGDGSAVPPDTARFPGAYSPDDPGIYLPDIYDTQEGEKVDEYQQPGPKPYVAP